MRATLIKIPLYTRENGPFYPRYSHKQYWSRFSTFLQCNIAVFNFLLS